MNEQAYHPDFDPEAHRRRGEEIDEAVRQTIAAWRRRLAESRQ